MSAEPTVFKNARLILPDSVIDGSLTCENGRIADIDGATV